MTTYRAAYWTDEKGAEIVLTLPEHAHLSDEELLAEAQRYAEEQGLDLSYGKIEIGEWGSHASMAVRYVALAPNSYHYCEYDFTNSWGSAGYTYIRKPDPTDRISYADKYVTHIELRPDVRIIVNDSKGAEVTWGPDKPCPFVRLD